MLFWVTTRGRERIFSNPRDSAIVRMASRRTLLLSLVKLSPLVGPLAARFENSGIDIALAEPIMGYNGFGVTPLPTVIGDGPTAFAPPIPVGRLPQPKPNCV